MISSFQITSHNFVSVKFTNYAVEVFVAIQYSVVLLVVRSGYTRSSGVKGSMYKVIKSLWRLLESCNQYRSHKCQCRYWCQCKSGVSR